MKRFAVAAGVAATLLAAGAAPASAASTDWHVPQCGIVDSDGSLSYSWSEGHQIINTTGVMRPYMSIDALTVLATPNTLLAVDFAGRLSLSRDAGCIWSRVGTVEGSSPWAITAAPDGSAYVWTRRNDRRLYRLAGTTVTELPQPPADLYGEIAALAVDRADPGHLRAVTVLGYVLDSRDGGQSFQQRGTTPPPGRYGPVNLYDAAIAADDPDHLVAGTVGDGLYSSTDGGMTWTHAGFAPGHAVNGFTVVMSSVDPNVVWAMVLDITEMDSGATSEGRHIVRSTDGGRTFTAVVDHVPGQVTLINGPLLVPHPTDPAVLYFEFGTWFGGYGTDLFRYDAGADRLTSTHNPYDDITAIAFNPVLPSVMYLGLAEQR